MSWPIVKLGDVATLINGRAYKKTELLESGPTPVLRVGNFFSNRSWYYSDLTLPEDKYCNEGDLLFAWSASFGPKIWDGPRAIYHYHIWKIVVSPAIDKNYLYHLLDSISAEIKSEGNGIAMIHATKGGMEKREIPLPPLAEQQKIAAILDATDQLRQKDQQLIEHYTRLGQALFLEMFGDPVRNPMGWEKKKILEVCSDIVDCVNKTAPVVDFETDFKMIRTTNVRNHKVDLSSVRYVEKETYEKWVRRLTPKRGDVIFTREAPVGEAGVLESDDQVFLGQRVMEYRTNGELMNPYYLLHELMGSNIKRQIQKLSSGSTVKHLSVPDCQKFLIHVPPITLQNQFAQHIEAIEQQKKSAQASLEKSEALFNSLLQRAFKGELTG